MKGEDEVDVYDLVDMLGLTDEMTCDEIFDKVCDYWEDVYCGNGVSGVIICDIASTWMESICDYLGIEYHEVEY